MHDTPRVFISYSHDSEAHARRVLELANGLREDGVDVALDQYVQDSPDIKGWDLWAEEQIDRADFVLVVCTETYLRRYRKNEPPGKGLGATYEAATIRVELKQASIKSHKFIGTVFAEDDVKFIPAALKDLDYRVLVGDEAYADLLRRLLGRSRIIPPQVGDAPELPTLPNDRLFGRPATGASAVSRRTDLIDFTDERSRHGHVFGREPLLDEIDRLLDPDGGAARWVLVQGSPGLGKSAIVHEYLKRVIGRATTPPRTHVAMHFIRRDRAAWTEPTTIVANLAEQLEDAFPDLAKSDDEPDRRFFDLLGRISREKLAQSGARVLIVVDGLDEAISLGADDNPLPRFLPHVLPAGVTVLCSSRPAHPFLGWFERRDGIVVTIDLDSDAMKGSNIEAVQQFWNAQGPRMKPPLSSAFIARAVEAAEGNLLHAVKLRDWLATIPVGQREVVRLPRGLEGLLELLWEDWSSLPDDAHHRVVRGLGILCASREPITLEDVALCAGWKTPRERNEFLRQTRQALLEMQLADGASAWRLYHGAFLEFLEAKIGRDELMSRHGDLARAMANPSALASPARSNVHRWEYAVRHIVKHRLEAGDHASALTCALDARWLSQKCMVDGPAVLVAELEEVARSPKLGEDDELLGRLIAAMHRAGRWLPRYPGWLPTGLHARLVCTELGRRWVERVFPSGRPPLALLRPVATTVSEVMTLPPADSRVARCKYRGRNELVVLHESGLLAHWALMPTPHPQGGVYIYQPDVYANVKSASGTLRLQAFPDGHRILRSEPGDTSIWSFGAGNIGDCTMAVDEARGWVAVAPFCRWVLCFNVTARTCTHAIGPYSARVRACCFDIEQPILHAITEDGRLQVFNMDSLQMIRDAKIVHEHIQGVEFFGSHSRMLMLAGDGHLRVLVTDTGEVLTDIDLAAAGPLLAAHPRADEAAIGDADLIGAEIVNWRSGLRRPTTRVVGDRVVAGAWRPDGQRLALGLETGEVKIFDPFVSAGLRGEPAHPASVTAVAAAGALAVSGDSEGNIRLWRLDTLECDGLVPTHTGPVLAVSIDERQQQMLSRGGDGRARLVDIQTGATVWEIDASKHLWQDCRIDSCDGTAIIATDADELLRVAMRSGDVVERIPVGQHQRDGCVAPVGLRRLIATHPMGAELVDGAMNQRVGVLSEEWIHGGVRRVALSPGGDRLCVIGKHGQLLVCELATLAVQWQHRIRGHGRWPAELIDVAWASETHVLTLDGDSAIQMWEFGRPFPAAGLVTDSPATCIASTDGIAIVGDLAGNAWFLDSSPDPIQRYRVP